MPQRQVAILCLIADKVCNQLLKPRSPENCCLASGCHRPVDRCGVFDDRFLEMQSKIPIVANSTELDLARLLT